MVIILLSFQDPRGSYVTDVFCTSATIGEKSHSAMIDKIHNDALALACSKHGSRSLEALWNIASMAGKAAICQKMAAGSARLKSSEFGAILYAKFDVRLYNTANKQGWADVVERKAGKRKQLQGILDLQHLAGGVQALVKLLTPSQELWMSYTCRVRQVIHLLLRR